jgi:stage IV sporulation protein A
LQTFPEANETVDKLLSILKHTLPNMKTMRDCDALEKLFDLGDDFINPLDVQMDMGTGTVQVQIDAKPELYYNVLSSVCGEEIQGDLQLMRYVCTLAQTKAAYGKVKDAFEEAEKNGYGIVYPTEGEYHLEKPRLLKKGAGYGAQFSAKAASYHVIKVDVTGAVSPIIGTKEQGQDFVESTLKTYEDESEDVWGTNIFGKSLRSLVQGELSGKNNAMPIELRRKMRRVLSRVVNEGFLISVFLIRFRDLSQK